MNNKRVKSFAVEDQYVDDAYDDGDYEEEDHELQEGTVKVRNALGPASAATTDKEIQDTLWHYYYDVPKSVAYIQSLKDPVRKENGKPGSKAANQQSLDHSTCYPCPDLLCTMPVVAPSFFHDAPWLNVPPHRKSEILVEPLFPRFGLLGGSANGGGKVSKLATLAAKRRQKESEKQDNLKSDDKGLVEPTTSGLARLRVSKNDAAKPASRPQLRQNRNATQQTAQDLSISPSPGALADTESLAESDVAKNGQDMPPIPCEVDMESLQAKPSPFAQTLFVAHRIPFHLNSKSPPTSYPLASAYNFAKPSPDDVVLKAQSCKGPQTVKSSKKISDSHKSVQHGLKTLSLSEPPKVKSKNLDVLAEYKKRQGKKRANFVVTGHVDSGKSTLMGRLLFDLKAVDERTMNEYHKQAEKAGKGSFAFAWILDQGSEERERGVTIDIATNRFETDRTAFTILDAPGHKDFVPNMIAGTSDADFAVLVIDASPGEFETGLEGQTKEHALLVRSTGIERMIVAVNKMDRVDWSQDRYTDIQHQLLAFLTKTGFKKDRVSFVPCSGLKGLNIVNRCTDERAKWYSGPPLVEELDESEPRTHAIQLPLRMTVADVYEEEGQSGPTVSGRIEAGSLQAGEEVLILPAKIKASIRSIRVDEEPREWAVAGQNVAMVLTHTEEEIIHRGDMLCSPASPARVVTAFTATVLAFEHLFPLPVEVHRGHLEREAKISKLVGILDKSNGTIIKKRPQAVPPGKTARITVELKDPAVIEAGRVVLRCEGRTLAAGHVE